jgi:hypothetical protein
MNQAQIAVIYSDWTNERFIRAPLEDFWLTLPSLLQADAENLGKFSSSGGNIMSYFGTR